MLKPSKPRMTVETRALNLVWAEEEESENKEATYMPNSKLDVKQKYIVVK